MKRVILCVDDFGLSPEVNEAVAELVDARVVSATSCLSLGPAWPDGAALLSGPRREHLDVGLHLNLTEAFAAAPALAMPLPLLIARALLRSLDPEWLKQAVCKQLDAFEAVWGAAPDYVDGHQHVHQLPQVREVLLTELSRRYGAADPDSAGGLHGSHHARGAASTGGASGGLPWLRLTRARRTRPGIGLKQRVIEALGSSAFERQARRAGFRLNGALLGVYGFDDDASAYASRFQAWLSQAQDGDVLMMHPARPLREAAPPPHQSPRGIDAARAVEYAVLRDMGTPLLAQAGVQAHRMARGPVF